MDSVALALKVIWEVIKMECQIRDISVYYEIRGDEDGIPLVMLHGWPADHHHCIADMERFFERRKGWKRIYFDQPGMGMTPGADWIASGDDVLDVIVDFIDHVIPDQHFAVSGVSGGAYLARGMVYRHARRMYGLLLIVPTILLSGRELPPRVTLVEDPQLLAEVSGIDEQVLRDFAVVHSRELLEGFRRNIVPAMGKADHDFLNRLKEHRKFSFDPDALPELFPAPTLFLMGRQDSICGYRDAWNIIEQYPRATFAVLDRAGHGLGDEQKVLYEALVSEWLDRVEEFARAAKK